MKKISFLFVMSLFLCVAGCSLASPGSALPVYQDLFVKDSGGYHTYRIPSLIVAANGDVLAFCEGRKNNRHDSGDIDIVVKRSTDGGKTFSEQSVVWDDANNTCGNPCPVVESGSGRLYMLATWNLGTDHEKEINAGLSSDTRRVYVLYSDDNGLSWSKPQDITKTVKNERWRWYATGPGVGIQLKYGEKKGRLVIPCDFSSPDNKNKFYSAHIIYSDDKGKTWQIGGIVEGGANECQVIERLDGALILNMRNQHKTGNRAVAYSYDGGQTFKDIDFVSNLVEPRCQASIIRYSPNKFTGENIVLFSNPNDNRKRINMSVKLSYDEAKTWPVAKTLYAGASGYSCLTVLPDGKIACLYEAGEKKLYEKIVLAIFDLDYLTNNE